MSLYSFSQTYVVIKAVLEVLDTRDSDYRKSRVEVGYAPQFLFHTDNISLNTYYRGA